MLMMSVHYNIAKSQRSKAPSPLELFTLFLALATGKIHGSLHSFWRTEKTQKVKKREWMCGVSEWNGPAKL